VELIAQQRTLSEEKLENAQVLIKDIAGLKTQASLLSRAQSTLDTIHDLRGEVDQCYLCPVIYAQQTVSKPCQMI
jgi:hypothetical protein